ncbi:MAG: L-histidine N(alpha)-methyltransferase [bacterium]
MAGLVVSCNHNGRFALDVRAGLEKRGQKELTPQYLYDDVGSALFEAITRLPEYGLTRAETRLIERHRMDLPKLIGHPALVIELGSGSGKKTRPLLAALARGGPLCYNPIDLSSSALSACGEEIAGLEGVTVAGIEAAFLDGLQAALAGRCAGKRALVLFLGSTIGNFSRSEAREFLAGIRSRLAHGDALLLGADLEKPIAQVLAAYDDPAGVTAAFNLNILGRLNRELGANFDLRRFVHRAVYNERERRIEMHLVSLDRQRVSVPAAGLDIVFERGETIWTESCHKYSTDELDRMAAAAGFAPVAQWVDENWPFALNVWMAGYGPPDASRPPERGAPSSAS